jgi:NADPH:quinone reductase-like Zn-dependent oxidoreductase
VKLLGILPTGRAASFCTTGSLDEREPGSHTEDLGAVLELLARREIHPVIAERHALTEAARAHELLEGKAVSGKNVLMTERSVS